MVGKPGPGIGRSAGVLVALLLAGVARADDAAPPSSDATNAPSAASPAAPPLPEVLKGLERASRLYLDTALRFACRETIVERSEAHIHSRRFEYLFVRDDNGALQDYRQVRAGKGQPPVRAEPIHFGIQRYLERAYMWVLVFKKDRQHRFEYRLEGLEQKNGKPTIRIGFTPVPPIEEEINDWFGTAWVDPATYQILRVEAMQTDRHATWARLQMDMEALRAGDLSVTGQSYRVERVTTEFSVVKNGMRFPSRVEIQSSLYYLPRGGPVRRAIKALEDRTEQTYEKYVFYAVRTSEEVNRILRGEPVPRK